MRKRFVLFAVLVIALITATLSRPRPAQCSSRCGVVNSVCTGQADLLNELCKAQGGSVGSCIEDYIQYYNECVTANGCSQLVID